MGCTSQHLAQSSTPSAFWSSYYGAMPKQRLLSGRDNVLLQFGGNHPAKLDASIGMRARSNAVP